MLTNARIRGTGIAVVIIAAGCSSQEKDVASTTGALHGAGSTPDTNFPSVVMVDTHGFCSGTLLSDHTALMAGHCVTSLAHHCTTESGELSSNGGVFSQQDDIRLSLNGHSALTSDWTETYTIDHVVPHPRSFFRLDECNATQTNNCGNSASINDNIAHVTGYDLAVVHFVVGPTQHPPSFYNVPIRPVITSVTDTNSSPAGTVHVNLNLATAITSSTNAWDLGWGNDDNVSGEGLRLIASEQFENTGSTFGQNCDGWFTCSGATNPNVSCASVTGNFADTAFHTQRWGSNGSATGGGMGSGDSGGPIFIHAGTGTGDVNDSNLIATAGGPYFQIGVNSGGTCDTGDGNPIGGLQCDMWFAPTWTADTGGWIDHILTVWGTDIDQDGVPTSVDNCSNLANAPQDNTNIMAETKLGDTPAGDACDVNATTLGSPGGEWSSYMSAPCTNVVINANRTFTLSSSGSCPVVFNTAITMRGNIGNAFGNAAQATGQSIPSYCDCASANSSTSSNCSAAFGANCVIASDPANPYLFGKSTGWGTITQYAGGFDQLYAFQNTVHEDPSDSNILTKAWTNQDVTSNWDYMADTAAYLHGGQTFLLGQLWTHLPPNHFTPAAGESAPATNRPSHYTDFLATQHPGYTFSSAPPLLNRFIPVWVKVIKTGPEVPYVLVGNEASGAVHVLDQTTAGSKFIDSRFDSTALSALSGVGPQTSDFIVADEAVASSGGLSSSAVRAIVTFANDVGIRAGLSQPYQVMTATTTTNTNTSFAPSVRAYSATTGKLYAIKNIGGLWKLYAFDVPSALLNAPSSTLNVIAGVTVGTPVALAYNKRDGNLYVIDDITVAGGTGLRLFRLTTAGVATEIWRTTGDSAVPGAYLSVSPIGELVLGLVRSSTKTNEVVLLDTNGYASGSMTATGLLLGRPTANESGVSVARTDSAGRAAANTQFTARSSLIHGVCGTTWLQGHVDSSSFTPLGYPAGNCP